jgi:pimeloyl-ACP methyl ester carboxylesterase
VDRDLTLKEGPLDRTGPVATHEIRGGGGLRLHAREWGDPDGPALLFIHGLSQSDLCWTKQLNGDLPTGHRIVTFDIRGHGLSEKPSGPEHYADQGLWADDLAAVIEQTGLERPVLVAWSYGGYIVTDYIRAYGESAIGGINLVGGAVILSPPSFDHIGPGLLENAQDMCASDLVENIAAIRRFVRACTAQPLDQDDWISALCWNMVVPPEVRGALIAREIDGYDVLSGISVPVLVTHGRDDAIILPSMAERTLDVCKQAVPSWYDDVGHMPFWESAERFDKELAEFVARVSAGGNGPVS